MGALPRAVDPDHSGLSPPSARGKTRRVRVSVPPVSRRATAQQHSHPSTPTRQPCLFFLLTTAPACERGPAGPRGERAVRPGTRKRHHRPAGFSFPRCAVLLKGRGISWSETIGIIAKRARCSVLRGVGAWVLVPEIQGARRVRAARPARRLPAIRTLQPSQLVRPEQDSCNARFLTQGCGCPLACSESRGPRDGSTDHEG